MSDVDRWAILLRKLVRDECTPAELAELEALRARDPHIRAALARIKPLQQSSVHVPIRDPSLDDRAAVERALAATRARIGMRPVRTRPRRAGAPRPALRAAAAVITISGVAGLIAVGWGGRGRNPGGPRVSSAQIIATRTGERTIITLSDGTRVTVAPQSRVTVDTSFTTGERSVTLEGEALFSVFHDARHPFTVRTARAAVTDLGTTFDVRAYSREALVEVAVAQGRVSLKTGPSSAHGPQEALTAGDLATVASTGATQVTHGQDLTPYTAWAAGRLVFRHVPLRNVVATLGRWYGTPFRIVDSELAREHLTLTLTTEAIDEAEGVLCSVAGARCWRDTAGTIVMSRTTSQRGASPHHP